MILNSYIADPGEARWRKALALWLCMNLLDAFDPSGDHFGCRDAGLHG